MMNWTADFPILAADENGNRLVYLDSAATTQHPMQVLNAVVDYYTKENANPHRGVYELAMRATDAHEGARHTVAQFFNAEDDEIVFTQNTTESLNLVAYSYGMNFLHEGDEIVISVAEHHSNMVPWQRVAKATGAKLVYMYPGENGRLTTEELDKKITPKTKVVAVAMVSNVLGLRAPVEEIVKRAHAVGAVVVLDCAQSAPHTPVDVKKLDVDFAACSAHKLYAPMGVGALYAQLNADLLHAGGGALLNGNGVPAAGTVAQQLHLHQNYMRTLGGADAGQVGGDAALGITAHDLHDGQAAARRRVDGQIGQRVGVVGVKRRLKHDGRVGGAGHGQMVDKVGVCGQPGVGLGTHAAGGKAAEVSRGGGRHTGGQGRGQRLGLSPARGGYGRQCRRRRGIIHAQRIPGGNREAVHGCSHSNIT